MTELLSEEHGLLGRVLDLFAGYGERVRSGEPFDPVQARRFLHFFREFGDLRHHEREEELLFPWLEARGFPDATGPLAVLRAEHEFGRDLRLALSLATDDLVASGDAQARAHFHELALRYAQFMSAHIEKEEVVLYPLIREVARQLGEDCMEAGGLRAEDVAWVEKLEAEARSWPRVSLSSTRFGTPYGFERLCEQSLD